MRSATELRQRWLDSLPWMLTRPEMYATSGQAFDFAARALMADLCFLDEREPEFEDVLAGLRAYGTLGVAGPFVAMFGEDLSCTAEVASVFAEQFHRLGYLDVERVLDADEWQRLIATVRGFGGRDVRLSEVVAEIGPASLVMGKRILGYAPADGSGWVFVDCLPRHRDEYVPGKGSFTWRRDDDPLARAVRTPATDFEAGLVLTLYGKVLRWGTAWWLDHDDDLPAAQRA
ncbi:hypothetical protein [Asanoa siamensis]|uniref:hypothetical protein n=1 Tax=Asanoa siamensis TaxID=926357 RepID=UPI0019450B35|nr:hypothetical protein [Asanoa siamensis]